jgi:rhodanese-related sulfurtransferase
MRGWILVVGLVFALGGCWRQEAAPSITPVELESLRATDEAPLVVDVRTPAEFATGHIPGAINIPFDRILDGIASIPSPGAIALYCMKGPRARVAEEALRNAGRAPLLHVEGGLEAWKRAGLPVER